MYNSHKADETLYPTKDDLQNDTSPNTHQLNEHNDSNPEAMPSNSFILSFNNLSYTVKLPPKFTCPPFVFAKTSDSENKVLLNDISGEAKQGQIMAIMGASGSGKSTLIEALAGRISKNSLKGSITLNGQNLLGINSNTSTSNILKSISAYVMQNDLLFPMLTVEETLMFSAELRLSNASFSKKKKKERVEELIDQLGLREVANMRIGDHKWHRGVSGGERKRVAIGVDIINEPIVMFLDEPTSGLDSTSSFLVVSVLRRIARAGSIVILSIHQPSSRILRLMDQLIILSNGNMVYSGSPSDLSQFFEGYCSDPIPADVNIAEYALDVLAELEESPGGTASLIEYNKSWQRRKNPWKSGFLLIHCGSTQNGLATLSPLEAYANPFWVEVYVIGKRSLINSKRMPESLLFRFGAVVLTGVMLASVFWRLDDTPKGAQERVSFFASAMTTCFFTCAESIPHFVQERFIFMRETSHNTYRRSSYVLSHSIIALPSLVLLSLTFSSITFWAVGLGGGLSGFLWFFLFALASFWAGHSFVTFVSALVPQVIIGYMMVVTLLAQFMLFSGFFITKDQIPPYWIWFHYISLVKYPYQGVMLNEFDNPFKCLAKGVQIFDNTPLKDAPRALKVKVLENMSEILGTNISSSCFMTGSDILQQQGVTDLSKLDCLLVTIAWGVFFRILFYVALLVGNKNVRK